MKEKQHNQFERLISLIGEKNFSKLNSKNILVIGIGGVGGYVVESLVRSGISSITIVDPDKVDITNINRQIIATHSAIGKLKVDVMDDRIKDINPNCKVKKYKLFLDEDTIDQVLSSSYDFVIDCCDTVKTKQLLIKETTKRNISFISSMGTANKLDSTKLEITELSKTKNDPLARILRKYVKEENIKKKIMVLSSSEVPIKNGTILATNSYIPSIAGLMISEYVIKTIMK